MSATAPKARASESRRRVASREVRYRQLRETGLSLPLAIKDAELGQAITLGRSWFLSHFVDPECPQPEQLGIPYSLNTSVGPFLTSDIAEVLLAPAIGKDRAIRVQMAVDLSHVGSRWYRRVALVEATVSAVGAPHGSRPRGSGPRGGGTWQVETGNFTDPENPDNPRLAAVLALKLIGLRAPILIGEQPIEQQARAIRNWFRERFEPARRPSRTSANQLPFDPCTQACSRDEIVSAIEFISRDDAVTFLRQLFVVRRWWKLKTGVNLTSPSNEGDRLGRTGPLARRAVTGQLHPDAKAFEALREVREIATEAMRQLGRIEFELQDAPTPPGMGHNRPPPLDQAERNTLLQDLESVANNPPIGGLLSSTPGGDAGGLSDTSERIGKWGAKIREWVASVAIEFAAGADEAIRPRARKAGKEFGRLVLDWKRLLVKLTALSLALKGLASILGL